MPAVSERPCPSAQHKLTNPSFSSWRVVCLSIAILLRLAVAGPADVLGGSFAIAGIV